MNIVYGVRDYDIYFELKKDCIELLGFSSIQNALMLCGVLHIGLRRFFERLPPYV